LSFTSDPINRIGFSVADPRFRMAEQKSQPGTAVWKIRSRVS